MNYEEEIKQLKAKVEALENDTIFLYDTLNKRIDDIQTNRAQDLTFWGIIVAVIIGGIQIIIGLLSKS